MSSSVYLIDLSSVTFEALRTQILDEADRVLTRLYCKEEGYPGDAEMVEQLVSEVQSARRLADLAGVGDGALTCTKDKKLWFYRTGKYASKGSTDYPGMVVSTALTALKVPDECIAEVYA